VIHGMVRIGSSVQSVQKARGLTHNRVTNRAETRKWVELRAIAAEVGLTEADTKKCRQCERPRGKRRSELLSWRRRRVC
jgi:hypothetical protein